jgi:hypothetical protein
MPLAPSGELTSIGLGREVGGYGVAPAVPSVFIPADNVSFDGTNSFNEKPGARKRIGRTRANTGLYMGKGSADFEADPDSIGALLALTCGTETVTTNALNPGSAAAVATTVGAGAGFGAGWQTVTPTAMTGIAPGQSLTIDTAGLLETVIVKASSTTTFTAYFKFAHAAGVTIVNATLVTAYDHTFTLASPRPSFTAQINRITDARNCVGNKVSQLSFATTAKAILTAKLTTEYQTELITGSPTTPAYSTLDAFSYENPANQGLIAGVASDATLQSWQVDINTGLTTDFPNFNGGRLRGQLPETVTKVSGSAVLAYETETVMKAFWGNVGGATGPQTIVVPLSFLFKFVANDFVNATVPYALQVILGTCLITSNTVPLKAASYLTQSVKFECYESTNGASDDFRGILTNAASGASI